MKRFSGELTARSIEVRFAYGGKVAGVGKKAGDRVRQWEWIASLDKKPLQAELDLELSDYERVRADFEMFKLKNGADGGDDMVKYERQQKQSMLNAAVKRVEIAKARMDLTDIVSPVAGYITQMEGLVAGINVTPASAPVTIIDTASYVFEFTVTQKDVASFMKPQKVTVHFDGRTTRINGTTIPPTYGTNGNFTVRVPLSDVNDILPGMTGEVTVD